jgi:hypothetical protein
MYLFADSGESVEELRCVDDELVEVDQSVFMLQCRNLCACTYTQPERHITCIKQDHMTPFDINTSLAPRTGLIHIPGLGPSYCTCREQNK